LEQVVLAQTLLLTMDLTHNLVLLPLPLLEGEVPVKRLVLLLVAQAVVVQQLLPQLEQREHLDKVLLAVIQHLMQAQVVVVQVLLEQMLFQRLKLEQVA
jgi:hypothetical protein